MVNLTVVKYKPSLQLEGSPFFTEITETVYEDLRNSNSKYLDFDTSKNIITIKKSFFKRNKQVQNVTRYFAQILSEEIIVSRSETKNPNVINSNYNDELVDASYKSKTIAIILESPHIDEYTMDRTSEKIAPIAPAQGQTGKKIDASIQQLVGQLKNLNLIEENCIYRIAIICPVPFQTSLHLIHEKPLNNHYRELRDKVWIRMWAEMPDLKGNFNLLLSSFKKESIIINACTKSLKPFINQELFKLDKKVYLLESNHPTSTESWVKSLFKIN